MVQNEVQGVMHGEYGAGECGAVWCGARVVQGMMQNEVQVVQDEYGAGWGVGRWCSGYGAGKYDAV